MKNAVGYMGVTFLLVALVYAGYRYHDLDTAYQATLQEYTSSTEMFEYQYGQLTEKLSATDAQNNDLKMLLGARQAEKEAMGQEVQTLSQTVGTLDKLTKTDKQLLEKYSSVYFLNENYVPQSLTPIDTAYLTHPDKPAQFITGAYPHLVALLQSARNVQIPLQILSSYRSFGVQASLKTSYRVTYGSGAANSFSADQGYSEHQLATAVDFTTTQAGSTLEGFDKSSAFPWLVAHAYQYGFILSYPKANTHFVFEPWHWRYVGVELATKLHNDGKNFYDLDQRTLDTYLIKFFD